MVILEQWRSGWLSPTPLHACYNAKYKTTTQHQVKGTDYFFPYCLLRCLAALSFSKSVRAAFTKPTCEKA
jgi:hypothetical protein